MSLVRSLRLLTAVVPCLLAGCGSDPLREEGSGDAGAGGSGVGAAGGGAGAGKAGSAGLGGATSGPSAEDLATAEVIGSGDGSPESVELTVVYAPSQHPREYLLAPTALAWNSARPAELWVTLRDGPSETPCNEGSRSACEWLWGYAAILTGADQGSPSVEVKVDDNAWHFMRRPTSIAFGDADLFATCGEARTANYEDEDIPFNGPVLWSSDPNIFGAPSAVDSPTGSTHIDMLHASPYCMGIASERDNIYWAFNGDAGSLDRYDFHVPHEPGADDHSDGELWRYVTGQLLRVPEVPSHLAYEDETEILYAADTGHHRVVRLYTRTGVPDVDVVTYDPIETHVSMAGARLDELVPPGVLELPSGLALHQGVVFVTDPPTRRIVAFDREGRKLRELDSGLPSGALGAVGVSPGGTAYITDTQSGRVLRIDPR